MKIIYNENPLKTKIIIESEEEYQDFKEKLRIYIHYDEEEDKMYNDYSEEWFESFARHIVDKGFLEGHNGDCICVPATCEKCIGEGALGLMTNEGIKKHIGWALHLNFRDGESKEQALANLAIRSDTDSSKAYEFLKNWKKHEEKP